MLSAMVLTNPNTIGNLAGVAKLTPNLILPDLKPRKAIHAPTPSNVQTAKETTKPTRTHVLSGDIVSTENGTSRNTLRSVTTDQNPSALKQAARTNNDYTKSKNFFSKRSKEFYHHQHDTRIIYSVRHHSYPRTALVRNTENPECLQPRRRIVRRILSPP